MIIFNPNGWTFLPSIHIKGIVAAKSLSISNYVGFKTSTAYNVDILCCCDRDRTIRASCQVLSSATGKSLSYHPL